MKETERKKSLKQKIRDLKRSIENTTNQEELAQKQEKLAELKILKGLGLKNANIWGKYKTIRFFEQKKVGRKLKKINKEIEEQGENEDLLQQKRSLMDDLNYIKYYPINKKYVSLFAESSENSEKERIIMRKHINKIIEKKQKKKLMHLEEELRVDAPKIKEDIKREIKKNIKEEKSKEPIKKHDDGKKLRINEPKVNTEKKEKEPKVIKQKKFEEVKEERIPLKRKNKSKNELSNKKAKSSRFAEEEEDTVKIIPVEKDDFFLL
ncbi:unnamed protein product [Blepharisma stoltei]|uniref:rRNA-processing protein EFG1 n=1 Tax=Blepharisma stoltei TaxID=1481888 RepID=A0AAU9JFW6_9CILI|nr:unnamed protein product [Blepharisma stoltei]